MSSLRSWISSRTMCENGEMRSLLSRYCLNIPYVMNSILVESSHWGRPPMWYPTSSPILTPISSATRRASATAEIRLGCTTSIFTGRSWSYASEMICGTCVLFPQPVGPAMMVTRFSLTAAPIWSRALYAARVSRKASTALRFATSVACSSSSVSVRPSASASSPCTSEYSFDPGTADRELGA